MSNLNSDHYSPLSSRLGQFAVTLATGLWLGGLTFYAGFVVPIGTAQIGSIEQGFITQRVSHRLNIVGCIAVTAMGFYERRSRSRSLWVTWTLLAAFQLTLIVLHPLLDRSLDAVTRTVPDRDTFYQWHRAYLIITAGIWLVGLLHVWNLLRQNGTLRQRSP